MRGPGLGDKTSLRFHRAESRESAIFSGFVDLAETVFGEKPSPLWPVWAIADNSGRCVAGLQCHLLRIACDGMPFLIAALRNVAVAVEWRGRGLMRDLFARVLPWCDANAVATLLYAETPDLYERFGFASQEQHAFEGPAPAPAGVNFARPIDPGRARDVIADMLTRRCPISASVAVVDDGGLTAEALARGDWPLFHDATRDALIACERDGETLTLVDVVASRMPSAAAILGALGMRPRRLETLFPPDRLDWQGTPVADDTGLMVRGLLPPATRRPFMLPPTVEF